MPSDAPYLLTINGGSSSIKFAAYRPADPPVRLLVGQIDRIGQGDTTLTARSAAHGTAPSTQHLSATDHRHAAEQLVRWLAANFSPAPPAGIGHRVVHGGVHLLRHQVITPRIIDELKKIQPLDLAHLPREIALIETLRDRFPSVPQVACFDTAFFADLPPISQILPIPRRYFEAGVRRFGFHGLSYTYLMEELRHQAGDAVASSRVILAHLGNGASMAAVRNGDPLDTTMAFTPLAGLVMGTRPGDLDPGLLAYLIRTEHFSAEQLDDLLSHHCGMLGVSGTSADMRDLLARRPSDPNAAQAIALFVHCARKHIAALAATLGGLDTLVFSGGIGERSPDTRAEICQDMQFLGLQLDPDRNRASAAVISTDESPVSIRVIPTDEEQIIAREVLRHIESPVARAPRP
ncbi:MAG TPA: acetate/propionate family kinase [Tepidisphaeraceae bacterium]|jgi:acetate kinase